MSVIDLILNFAGLLLLLNWRSLRLDAAAQRAPATLAGTLKPVRPSGGKGWLVLGAVAGLVTVRGFLYWQIGSPADWTPKLDLGFILIPFPVNSVAAALLYSALSLVRIVILAFCWMMILLAVNSRLGDSDPVNKLLRLQMRPFGHWPAYVQVLLPPILALGSWIALHPVLTELGLMAQVQSLPHLVMQGLLVAIAMLLTVKYLLGGILFLYLLSSYVYLGRNPVWDFARATGAAILGPVRKLPLRTGKLDLAPLVGIVLVFLLLHALPTVITAKAAEKQLTLWPQ